MPRQRKTQTGAAAQPVGAVAGQTYGLGVEQQRMQEAMPLPNTHAPTAIAPQPTAPAAAPGGAPAAAPAPGPSSLEEAMAAAKAMQPDAGLLTLPTQRPNEPITHGLSTGAGGGPEALGRAAGSPVGKWMRDIARQSGNPYLQELADRIGM